MDKTLEKSKAILDEIESKTQGQYWRTVNDLTIDDNIPDDDTDNDSFYEESDSNTDSTSSSEEETRSTKTLGDKVIDIWNKRRYKLVTDFAIAGWLLSPIRCDFGKKITPCHFPLHSAASLCPDAI